jgi:ABC-type sugar transport system ATPase subunit
MTATVDIVELAGDQIFLELDVAGALLVARVEPDFKVERGDVINFWFHTESLHLFDPESELSLTAEEVA